MYEQFRFALGPFHELTWHRVLAAELLRRSLARDARSGPAPPREPCGYPPAGHDGGRAWVDPDLAAHVGRVRASADACDAPRLATEGDRSLAPQANVSAGSILSDHRLRRNGWQQSELLAFVSREVTGEPSEKHCEVATEESSAFLAPVLAKGAGVEDASEALRFRKESECSPLRKPGGQACAPLTRVRRTMDDPHAHAPFRSSTVIQLWFDLQLRFSTSND